MTRRRWLCVTACSHSWGLGIIFGWRHMELSIVLGPVLIEIFPRE